MADVEIRTTITANSIQRLFGPPGAINYRSHPGQREPDSPSVVFAAMVRKEVEPLADVSFLKGTIYSFKNRRIITKWIRDVSAAFSLKGTTLNLAVQLTDAFLVKNLSKIPVNHCQLVAVASTWIAAKFEETDDVLPSIKALVEVCDGAYTKDQILDMEERILGGFNWRIPHSTCINFLYLYLHMHGNPAVAKQLMDSARSTRVSGAGGSASSKSSSVTAVAVVCDAQSKTRRSIPVSLPAGEPLSASVKALCAAANVHFGPTVELFELAGTDFYLGKRIDQRLSPLQMGVHPGNEHAPLKIFVSTGGGNTQVFAEADDVVILRSVNALMLHVCEVLAAEVITHVEFLRLPSHVVALGVLALARCLTGTAPTEARIVVVYIVKALGISASQALAAAELLGDKYSAAVATKPEPSVPPPIVEVPADLSARLKFIFSKD
jgi:hypothetical protein